jgi:hypothetical protein
VRMYESIWQAIKKLEDGKELPVRIHNSAKARLIQAVKLEKTKDVSGKRKVGILTQGPLVIRSTVDTTAAASKDFSVVYFSLKWDWSKL